MQNWNKNNSSTFYKLAQIKQKLGQFSEAIKYVKNAIELSTLYSKNYHELLLECYNKYENGWYKSLLKY